jgi:hypothetical protein
MGDNPPMAKAIALTQRIAQERYEIARTLIVCGCAIALIAAGQALPSL